MVARCGQLTEQPQCAVQPTHNSWSHRKTTEEAHFHRNVRSSSIGTSFFTESKAHFWRDLITSRQLVDGKGSSPSLVLQSVMTNTFSYYMHDIAPFHIILTLNWLFNSKSEVLHSFFYYFWSRRQKEKRINPPSGGSPMGSPTHHPQMPHSIFGPHGLSLNSSGSPIPLVTGYGGSPNHTPNSTNSQNSVIKQE